MKIKNIILDWAGTLCDDLTFTVSVINEVLSQYNRPQIDITAFRKEFHLPYSSYYKKLMPEIDITQLESRFNRAFRESSSGIELFPEVIPFLSFCRARDLRCFTLSSSDSKTFEQQITQLGIKQYFECTYSGIINKKTYIKQLLQNHDLNANETVFIGDMTHDIDAAHNAGVLSVSVLTGYNNINQLASANPDIIVANLAIVEKILG